MADPMVKRQKFEELTRLLGRPDTQTAFFTPKGGIDVMSPKRLQSAQDLAVQSAQKQYRGAFKSMEAPDWTRSQWIEIGPVSGQVKFKSGLTSALKDMGFADEEITGLRHKLSQKLGAYKDTGTYTEGLSKSDLPSDLKGPEPQPGTSEEITKRLQTNKNTLFGQVAKALQGASSDYEKAAIVREAFGQQGGNPEQLFKEFGGWADAEGQRVLKEEQERAKKAAPRGALGQILESVDVLSDISQNLLRGHGQDALENVKDIPRAIINIASLGTVPEPVKKWTEIDRSHDVNFTDLVPILKELQQRKGPGHGVERAVGFLGSFGGEVATDPLSYLTLGTGAIGKAGARSLLKGGVERLALEGGEEAAKGASMAVAQAYGKSANFKRALKAFEDLGYNPEALAAEFPRVGLGRKAAAATQVRGGLTIRAGVPGTKAKVAVNVVPFGYRTPLGAVGLVLDRFGATGERIQDGFGLATALNRFGLPAGFEREFPELAETFKGVAREARGHEKRAIEQSVGTFRAAQKEMRSIAKAAHLTDDEFQSALNDAIELGATGPHYAELVAKVGSRDADLFTKQAQQINEALDALRQKAIALGADIPELAAQAAGDIRYLPHGRIESETERKLLQAGIKPAKVGYAKQRLLTVGGGITDPSSGSFHPTPLGTINQINAVNRRIFGTDLVNADAFGQLEIYARAIGKVINNTHLSNRLQAEWGLPEVDSAIAQHYKGVIDKPEARVAAYLGNIVRAKQAVQETEHAVKVGVRDMAAAARSYARSERAAVSAVASVQRLRELQDINSEIFPLILRKESEKRVLDLEAQKMLEHEQSIFSAQRDAELRVLREAGAAPAELRATSAKYEAFLADIKAEYTKVRNTLHTAPGALRSRAQAHLRSLGPEASAALRGASGRPYGAILQDALDTTRTITNLEAVAKYGRANAFTAIHTAMQTTEFGRILTRATAVSQKLGELEHRISNETRAGRHAIASDLERQRQELLPEWESLSQAAQAPEYKDEVQQVLAALDDPELSEIAAAAGGGRAAKEAVARYQEAAVPSVPVDDLLAEQRAAVAAGDTKRAGQLAEEIGATRELGAKLQVAQAYVEAERAMRELAELGLKADPTNKALSKALKEHLAASVRELDELARTGRTTSDPERVQRALQARYLHEEASGASILHDDWLRESRLVDEAIAQSATLQEQITRRQAVVSDLISQKKLRAYEFKQAKDAFENLTAENADAVTKLLAQPTLIEQTVPHLSELATVVETLPYANKTLVLPEDISKAIRTLSNKKAHGTMLRNWAIFTNAWKRGTLAIPGSTGRRFIGEVIATSYYAGVQPQEIAQGIRYAKAIRAIHGNLDAAPPDLPLLRGMVEQNIFEGRLVDVFAEGGIDTSKGLFGNKIAPLKRWQDAVFRGTAAGEDALRAAMFISAKNLGMSDVGARSHVGKYLFFHDEMSELERGVLRNAFPFWSFLRNNTELQLYMLFHTPGKISAFQNLQESMGQPIETPFGPSSVLEQGGIVSPLKNVKGQQEVFYPGTLDIPQGVLAISDLVEAVGAPIGALASGEKPDVGGNEALGSANPLVAAGLAGLFNVNAFTGGGYSEKEESFAPFGHELGQLKPRQRAVLSALFPEFRQFESLTAATPARREAVWENIISMIAGPTFRPITERSQSGEAARIADILGRMNKAQGNKLETKDIEKIAKDKKSQDALRAALERLQAG